MPYLLPSCNLIYLNNIYHTLLSFSELSARDDNSKNITIQHREKPTYNCYRNVGNIKNISISKVASDKGLPPGNPEALTHPTQYLLFEYQWALLTHKTMKQLHCHRKGSTHGYYGS